MNTCKYEELTAKQIKCLIKDNCVLLLNFGSIEQHGEHLPVGTDYICMEERVEDIAKQTNSIFFSPIKLGYSYNHIGMTGTISLSSDLFIEVVKSILLQIFEQGWSKCIIFSGHNGNWNALRVALQVVKEQFPEVEVVLANGYPKMDSKHNKNRFYKNFDMHAGVVETALINYFRPDLFDQNNIPLPNDSIPSKVKEIINKEEIDDIDELLLSAVTPQHTNLISKNGVWGKNDIGLYKNIPVKEAMDQYVKFYIDLINRWRNM